MYSRRIVVAVASQLNQLPLIVIRHILPPACGSDERSCLAGWKLQPDPRFRLERGELGQCWSGLDDGTVDDLCLPVYDRDNPVLSFDMFDNPF